MVNPKLQPIIYVLCINCLNISSLVLDSSIGRPAVDIGVFLEQFNFELSTFEMLGKGYSRIRLLFSNLMHDFPQVNERAGTM